ncbi:MAG: T9SS type A sorting domain-containing protein [Ignavibacteria bacterium]|nr:T9SS type A sorting domain-containing protein [Ignavibacteria bacterium]
MCGCESKASRCAQNIAEQTGGTWFENVTSTSSIEEIYTQILDLAVSGPPCEVVWETNLDCTAQRTATIKCQQPELQTNVDYTIQSINLPKIIFSTHSARFPNVPPGNTDFQDVTVTAITDSITISSVTLSNADFTIENAPPPDWKMNKGETKTFRIRFTPTDSSLTFAEINVVGNLCFTSSMYAIGGYSGFRKPSAQLRVLAPNGGERFSVGDTTTLRWTGILPMDTVRLDYTIDGGVTWMPITNYATGLEYLWTVPNTPGNRCLLRASQYQSRGSDTVYVLSKQSSAVYGVCFNPDGARVATISSNGTLQLWNASNGTQLVPPIATKIPYGSCIDWSPDGQRIAIGNNGVEFYDGSSFSFVQRIDSGAITSCAFSKDGMYFITNNGSRNKIGLWSMQTQNFTQLSSGHTGGVNHLSIVNNKQMEFAVLSASSDRTARRSQIQILKDDLTNGLLLNYYSGLDFSSSDVGIAYLSNPTDTGSACAAFKNGDLLFYPTNSIIRPFGGDGVNKADWSPDGKSIAFAMNSGVLAIMDVASKKITRTLDTIHKSALSIRWDATSTKIVAGYINQVAVIWQVADQIDQQDTSDKRWEITTPTLLALKNVDLGSVTVNSTYDSLVQSILCITQNPLSSSRLDTAFIVNDPDRAFRIVAGVPAKFPSGLPACIAIEVGFSPQKIGQSTATLRMFSNGQSFDVLLSGIGIDLELTYPKLTIDFGKVPVGISKDSLINPSTTNTGILPITISKTSIAGPDIKQFFVIGGDTTIQLTTLQSSQLLITFAPRSIGRTSSLVRIDFTRDGVAPAPGSPIYLQLHGEGVCGIDSTRIFNVCLGKEIPAVVGAIVQIPIVMKLQPGQSQDVISSKVTCKLSFDATMLLPLEPMPVGSLDSSRRTVTYVADRILNSDTLLLLPMLTMLGMDSMVTVRIDSIYFDDGGCPLKIQADSVTIKLIDLCTEGGSTRLLVGSPITQISLLPNPANDNPNIVLVLAEDTPVTISLINTLGQEVMVMRDELPRGSHRMTMDATDIPVGMYSLRMTTRSEVKVMQFVKW